MRRFLSVCLGLLILPTALGAQVGNFSKLVLAVDARTIASNGGGTAATLTLIPLGSYVAITCNDPDGCAITMGETGIQDGMPITIVNMSSNAVTFADTAGVSELTGAASLGQYSTLTLIYRTDRWVEVSRSAGSGAGTVTTTGSPANGNLAFFSGASSITNGNLSGEVTTSGTGAATITNNAVTNAKLRDSGALSVIGRSANSSGDPADISASAASDAVLRESGSTLGFGTIATGAITDGAVTYAKMQDVSAASRFLCRGSASGSGDVQECTFGSGLSLSGTQLTATGGGGGGGGSSVFPTRFEFRLGTESGACISTADRTSQSTIYLVPCLCEAGSCLAITTGVATLWNGTDAVDFATTQLSKVLSSLTSGANYDVFLDYNGGSPQLVLSAAWSTDIARTDALSSQYDSTRQVTLLIKSGTPAYRWVGTIRTTSTTTTEDSAAHGFVWNAYNRVLKFLSVNDSTDSWTWNSASWHQANATPTNHQVDYVVGDASMLIRATVQSGSNGTAGAAGAVGIGIDATNANSAQVFNDMSMGATQGNLIGRADYQGYPGLGYHYIAWIEYARAGTMTFLGDSGVASMKSGILAPWWQ